MSKYIFFDDDALQMLEVNKIATLKAYENTEHEEMLKNLDDSEFLKLILYSGVLKLVGED